MKTTNYMVGYIGLASLIISIYVCYFPSNKIKMKEGTYYYHENPGGLGYLTTIGKNPTYNFVLFNGSHELANPFFEPMNLQIGEDLLSATVVISPYDGSRIALTAYYSKEKRDQGYARISRSYDDRIEHYVDIDGDYLPDRRQTEGHKKFGVKSKFEKITYSYEEIEQAVDGNPH